MTKIDEKLLRIMECPVAHVPLVQVDDWLYSTDPKTRRKYPIRDGIPIMLVEEAQTADSEEFEHAMRAAGFSLRGSARTEVRGSRLENLSHNEVKREN